MSQNSVAPVKEQVPTERDATLRAIEEAEQQALLDAFAELKRRPHGELRIATRTNRASGVKEVVYMGIHEQQNIDRLRKLYQRVGLNGNRPTTF